MDKFDQSRSRGFAFVKCATQADADKIIADFSEKEFMGRPLRVNMAGQGKNMGGAGGGGDAGGAPKNQGPGETELYVGSLAWETRDEDLTSEFGKFGTVVSARVVMDRNEPTRSRGFGFVKVSTRAEAEAL